MKKLFLLTIISIPFLSSSQDLNYAKEVVKTLASDEYYGRGYVNEGDKIAATYIASEFEKIGLKKFKKSYFQNFTTPVNTFPDAMNLTIDGKSLQAGVDYLIEAGSPETSGRFSTIYLSIDDLLNQEKLLGILRQSANKFIVIPPYNLKDYSKEQQQQINDVVGFVKYSPNNPASGSILLTKDKLTWSGSTVQYSKPSFTVLDTTNQKIDVIETEVETKFIPNYKTQNVIGYLEGLSSDSLIVLIAHYDHLGMMGKDAMFPGANDNASGIAMLLNLAKDYAQTKPKYSTVFIAFGGEELGLLGAKYFTENPLFKLSKIKFLLNFDISGTGDDGIQVVNGKVYQNKFDQLVKINEEQSLLKQVKIRGEACNSDHCMFHMNNVPCFFIYTLGGIQAYHDVYDKSETLPLTAFEDYFRLIKLFIDQL